MPDVLMNYPQMDEMVQKVNQTADAIEASIDNVGNLSSKLADAFQGAGGSAMQNALNQTLKSRMADLHGALANLSQELQNAIEDTKAGVQQSKSPYVG